MELMDELKKAFAVVAPDSPPPGGMTFEQRAILIGALYELKDRGRRPLEDWLSELRRALGYSEATRSLAEAVPHVDRTHSNEDVEKRASDLVRIGIRLSENHPVAAFGGDARHLVAESVEGALAKSHPVRLLRFLLPTLCILFGGGLLWGSFQIQGFKETASQARQEIQREKDDVSRTAGAATNEINRISNSAQTNLAAKIQEEARSQLKDLTRTVEEAKAEAKIRINGESEKINQWGKDRRHEIDVAAEDQKAAINRLASIIENAKVQAAAQAAVELGEIKQWGETKRSEISAAAKEQVESINSLKPAIETIKAQAAPKLQAELDEIKQWGATKRSEISAAAKEQEESINSLKPAIETIKAQAAPKLQAELDEIKQWGATKRSEISAAAKEQEESINSLKPAIETIKAQAAPKLQAELEEIKQWGIAKLGEITAAATAANKAIAEIAPAVQGAKDMAAVKIAAIANDAAEWGRGQKGQFGTALDQEKESFKQDMASRRNDVQAEQTRVKTELALLLNDVRSGNDDVLKRLLATQEKERTLSTRLGEIKEFVDQSIRLQTVIERADAKGTLTFQALVSALEWKDGIAIGAGILSLLAFAFGLFALFRRRKA